MAMYAAGDSGVSRSCRLQPAARSIDDHGPAAGGRQHGAVDRHADHHERRHVAVSRALVRVVLAGAEDEVEERRQRNGEDQRPLVAQQPAHLEADVRQVEAAERWSGALLGRGQRRQRARRGAHRASPFGGCGRVVAGQGDERVLQVLGGDLEVVGAGVRQQVPGDRVGVARVDPHGVPANLDGIDAGHAQQRHLVGPGQRRPDRPAGGQRLDLGGRAVRDDPAVAHQDDPVGVEVGLLEVVRGEQHGAAALRVPADGRPEVPASLDVHPGGRLVEDQQLRVGQQGHREPQPLLLAAGALADQPVADVARCRPAPGPRRPAGSG